MRDAALAEHYRRYIETLNERPVGRLSHLARRLELQSRT